MLRAAAITRDKEQERTEVEVRKDAQTKPQLIHRVEGHTREERRDLCRLPPCIEQCPRQPRVKEQPGVADQVRKESHDVRARRQPLLHKGAQTPIEQCVHVAEHAVGRRVAEPRRLVRARVVARVLEDRRDDAARVLQVVQPAVEAQRAAVLAAHRAAELAAPERRVARRLDRVGAGEADGVVERRAHVRREHRVVVVPAAVRLREHVVARDRGEQQPERAAHLHCRTSSNRAD